MWQVKLWVNARTTELIAGSPFEYGWTTTDDGIELLEEYMTALEMIDGLVCDCKGMKRCKDECPCCHRYVLY